MCGFVLWITGLSGSGKTTLAKSIIEILKANKYKTMHLDGDQLREILLQPKDQNSNYDHETRRNLAFTYAKLAKFLSKDNFIVVVSTISLYNDLHDWNRSNIDNYFEVYLDVPLQKLKERDAKGIYAKYKRGAINQIAGLDLDVEFPKNPDHVIEYDGKLSAKDSATQLFKVISPLLKNQWTTTATPNQVTSQV